MNDSPPFYPSPLNKAAQGKCSIKVEMKDSGIKVPHSSERSCFEKGL